jgi:hypothetical protein
MAMNNPNPDQDASGSLTQEEIDALFEANMRELDKMYVPAGSMVKGLIMELQRKNRNTYIRLKDAEKDGHVVYYELVQGEQRLVNKFAKRLGFKTVTESKLEVRGA